MLAELIVDEAYQLHIEIEEIDTEGHGEKRNKNDENDYQSL